MIMSDMTMCHGFDCPVKEKCKRFSSIPNEHWQAYFLNPPYTITDKVFECNMFWGDTQDAIMKQLMGIVTGKDGEELPE
jgi:hypothetical protein